MKLWHKEQNIVKNIFKLNPNPVVALVHAQIIRFETWSDFTGQFFGTLKQFLSFSSQRYDKTLKSMFL